MIVIDPEQMDEITRGIEEHWKQEFAARLRHDQPTPTAHMSDEQLGEYVRQGYDNALELEVTQKEDIYRFLKLAFLPKELLESDFTQSVLIRVLNNLSLSGTKRLDFIEQHVVKRAAV